MTNYDILLIMNEVKNALHNLQARVNELIGKLELNIKQNRKRELEAQTLKPNFWDNREKAEAVTAEIAEINTEQEAVSRINKEIEDCFALMELVEGESESIKEENLTELLKNTNDISRELDKLETALYLGGKYDREDAWLSIRAGQGGTEACDWAEILSRMYRRYAERKNWKVEITDEVKGEEAGLKAIDLAIKGRFAYGYLKKEAGAHRLVRLSPYNANNLRQTSFALVSVMPIINQKIDLEIRDDDIEFEAYRASCHGGQNVQKVSTAVRIKHIPSGIVVTCQSERFQGRNREIAMQMLKSKLMMIEEEKREAEERKLKGDYKPASWGNQIRSYVLHPYKMVKDLRTDYESKRPDLILDGELDELIAAEMKAKL